jgi:hypothetical protein
LEDLDIDGKIILKWIKKRLRVEDVDWIYMSDDKDR